MKPNDNRIYFFIKALFCICILVNLTIPTSAITFRYPNNNLIRIQLLSKEQTLKQININSPVRIQQLDKILNSKDNWQIKNFANKIVLINKNNNKLSTSSNKLLLTPENRDYLCISTNNISKRCYHGSIEVNISKNNLNIINNVSIPNYLDSAVGSELPINWPEEAVKAQGVVIHTYLLYNLKKNKIIKDSTQNQFYGGVTYEKPEYNHYIDKITDIIMVDKNNQPIEALYHSTCAGKTLNNEFVFGGKAKEYLRSTPCTFDKESNFYKLKTYTIDESKFKNALNARTLEFEKDKKGNLKTIKINNKNVSLYNFWLKLGQNLGWAAVPSIKYNITCSKSLCKISSQGAGHAVGLCQWGARGLAKKGVNYQQILRYYYKNICFLRKNY